MAKQLTAVAVKRFQSGKRRREIRDGGCTGLHLVVQTSGHKSSAMRFRRPSGKPAKLTLGPVDLSGRETNADPVIGAPLTLASARGLAAEVHRQRARGSAASATSSTPRQNCPSVTDTGRPLHLLLNWGHRLIANASPGLIRGLLVSLNRSEVW